MNDHKNSRYPGLRPFQANEQALFFGRSKEIKELSHLIQTERLSVLFAKSGLGKSSILNAGVLPKLEEDIYRSIQIRVQNRGIAPLEAVEKQTEKYAQMVAFEAKAQKRLEALEKITKRPATTWEKLRAYNFEVELGITPILVFDQFEEFFLHDAKVQTAFIEFLADLAYERIPLYLQYPELKPNATQAEVKAVLEGDRTEDEELTKALAWWRRPLGYKVVIAIRSDKLSLLDRLSNAIPSILHHRYELKALQREQAKDAIILPAAALGDHYNSPTFSYSDAALNDILDSLSDEKGSIESFQLQIICQDVEQKIIEGAEQKNPLIVEASDLGGNEGIQNILNNYYNTQIRKIKNPEEQLAARRLIEEGLIVDGTRVSLGEASVRNSFKISDELLQQLLATRLIRIENTHLGKAYEVSHDTLVEPISKSAELRLRREAELKLQEELAIERRKKKRARRINIAFTLFSLLALILLIIVYFYYQSSIWENKRLKVIGQVAESSVDLVGKEYRAVIEKTIAVLEEVNETFTDKEHLKINKEYATATKNLYNAFYSNQDFFQLDGHSYNRPPLIKPQRETPFYFQLANNSHIIVEPAWKKQLNIYDRKTGVSSEIPFINPVLDKIIALSNGHQAWIKTTSEKGISFWDGENYQTTKRELAFLRAASPDGKTVICTDASEGGSIGFVLLQFKNQKITEIYSSSSAQESRVFEIAQLGNKGLYFAEGQQLFFIDYQSMKKQLLYDFQAWIDNIKITNEHIILFNKWNKIEILNANNYELVQRMEIDPMILSPQQQGGAEPGPIEFPEGMLGPDGEPIPFLPTKSSGKKGSKFSSFSSQQVLTISDHQWLWGDFYIEWTADTGFEMVALPNYSAPKQQNIYSLDENRWMSYSNTDGGNLKIYKKDKLIAHWQDLGQNLYFSIFSPTVLAAYNPENLESYFIDLAMIPMEAIYEPFDFSLATDASIATFIGNNKLRRYSADSAMHKFAEIQFEDGVIIDKNKTHEISLNGGTTAVFNTKKSSWQLYNSSGKVLREAPVEKDYDYLAAQPEGVHLLSLKINTNKKGFYLTGSLVRYNNEFMPKHSFQSRTIGLRNVTDLKIKEVKWLHDLDPSFVMLEITYVEAGSIQEQSKKYCLQLKANNEGEEAALFEVAKAVVMMDLRLLITLEENDQSEEQVIKAYNYDAQLVGLDSIVYEFPELFMLNEEQILLWENTTMFIYNVVKNNDKVSFEYPPNIVGVEDLAIVIHETWLNKLTDFYQERHGIIAIGHEENNMKKNAPSVVFAPQVEDGMFMTIADVLDYSKERQRSYLSKEAHYVFVETPIEKGSSSKKMLRYILDYKEINQLFIKSKERMNQAVFSKISDEVMGQYPTLNTPPFSEEEEEFE
jgi:hypothetical protein